MYNLFINCWDTSQRQHGR